MFAILHTRSLAPKLGAQYVQSFVYILPPYLLLTRQRFLRVVSGNRKSYTKQRSACVLCHILCTKSTYVVCFLGQCAFKNGRTGLLQNCIIWWFFVYIIVVVVAVKFLSYLIDHIELLKLHNPMRFLFVSYLATLTYLSSKIEWDFVVVEFQCYFIWIN